MGGNTMSRGTRRLAGLRAAAVLVLLLLTPATAPGVELRLPRLAVDPLPEIGEAESRAEALARWVSRDVAGGVLLLVDTASGAQPLGAARAAAIADIRRARAAGSPAPDLAETLRRLPPIEGSLVRAAVALGIVREVYWLTPFDYFRSPGHAAALPADMRKAGFTEEDVRTFAMRDGCFRGTLGETPLAVCGMEALPRIADPVLLGVNPEFILSAAATAATNPIAEIRRLIAALAGARYAVRDAVLIDSVERGRVPPDLRWVGETIGQALHDPSLLARPDPPRRWNHLQSATMQLAKGSYSDMLHKLRPFLAIHEEDPALQLFAAEGLTGLGKPQEALEHAEEACRLHPGYCYGLPWIGLRYFAAGNLDEAERFFASGARLRPEMTYGQLERGLFLLGAGREAEALRVFRVLGEGDAAFPGGFLAGALLLRAGDRQSARRQFDRALAALDLEPAHEVLEAETAQAVREAARLYREEGLPRQAEVLEGNPRLMPGGPASPGRP